jgi:hypothetical protein
MSTKDKWMSYFLQVRSRHLIYVAFGIFWFFIGICWFFKGNSILENAFGEAPNVEYFNKVVQELKTTDPEAAHTLETISKQRDMQEWAVAFKARQEADGLSGVRELAKSIEQGRLAYEKVLVDIASRPGAFSNKQERDHFFQAYDTYFEPIKSLGVQTVDEYSRSLERFVDNTAYWHAIKDDPGALVMLQNGVFDGEDQLLSFYVEQKDWLQAALSGAMAYLADNADTRPLASAEFIKNAMLRSMQFYPASKAFAEIDGDNGFIFSAVFLEYANILSPAVSKYHLPPEEVAGVIFANADQYSAVPVDAVFSPEELRRGEEQARELAYLREKKTSIWNKAQYYPLVLRFEKDALDAAERLLDKYEYLPEFIYSLYPNESMQAIRAVDFYGDPALYVLQKYSHSERMHELIRDKNVNTRIIPLILRRGDEAFSLMDEDMRWLDRYVERDGTPRNDSQGWLSAIPFVGAPAVVVNNWKNGYPNTWGELGWAAFDVASSVLLIKSLTVSAGKIAAGSIDDIARATGRAASGQADDIARGAWKAALGTTGATDDIVRGAGRMAAGTADDIARVAGKPVGQSFLKQYTAFLTNQMAHITTGTRGALRYTWNTTMTVMKNPTIRKWTARAYFAVYLLVVINDRTIPNLPDVGRVIGEKTGEVLHNTGKAVRNAFSEALTKTLDLQDRPKVAHTAYLFSWIPLILLAFFSWRALSSHKARY